MSETNQPSGTLPQLLAVLEADLRDGESPVDCLMRIKEERDTFKDESEFFRTATESMKAAHESIAAVAAPLREYRPRPVSLHHTLSVGGMTATISARIAHDDDGETIPADPPEGGQGDAPASLDAGPGPDDDAPDLLGGDSYSDLVRAMGIPQGDAPASGPGGDESTSPDLLPIAEKIREAAGQFRAWVDQKIAEGKKVQATGGGK